MNIFIQFWIQGFIIGLIITYLIYHILYKIHWFWFKYKGKRHNLKIVKCKSCNNSFYAYNFEITTFCCNCILINSKKENNEKKNFR